MKKFKELKSAYTKGLVKKSSTDHCPDGQRYDDSKDRCAPMSESKYGDAMSSRIPAHLEDPRVEPKPKKAVKPTKPVKESVWMAYRDRALSEELTPRERQAQGERLKPTIKPSYDKIRDRFEAEKKFDGSKMKHRAITSSPWIKGVDQMDEEHQSDFPNPGHVMDFHDRMEHSYHGGHEAKTARDAFAKHLKAMGHKVKKSSMSNQILHGNYGNVYIVSHKRPIEEAYDIAFNESGPPKHPYSPIDIYHRGIHVATTTWSKDQKHAKAKWLSLHPDHKESDVMTSYGKESLKEEAESYKVGDRVVPKIGPHKGEMHRVIHVHPTGHLNITPENRGHGRRNRYHLGAAKAHPNDVVKMGQEVHNIKWPQDKNLEENMTPEHERYIFDRAKHPNDYKKRPKQFIKWPAGVKITNVKPLVNRKTVQEVFQAAKDKKKEANPQKEVVDNLPTDGANEPNKDLSAAPPQFGKKEGSEEKKNNAPTPEKKTGKITVKGPGPDDKFQPDPIVTPLTTMPDTSSPKSGSQGVR